MLHERWIVIDGSIFTEALHLVKCELSDGKLKIRKAIAFNVGRKAAEHIVALHNAAIKESANGS
jgi:hypothetical protein